MWCPSRLKNLLLITLAVVALSLSSLAQAKPVKSGWSYPSTNWPTEYRVYCSQQSQQTIQQSPINLANAKQNMGMSLTFHYNAIPVPVEDTGHDIEVNYGTGSSQNSVTFNGKTYNLRQFHFHEPSEHTMNGAAPAAMEVHLVHKATDGSGKLLVVGVLINQGSATQTNPTYDQIMTALKNHNHPAAAVNPGGMLPGGGQNNGSLASTFYTYTGSLTTPPCTPGITWVVLTNSIYFSPGEITEYKYPKSSRGAQPSIPTLLLQTNQP